MDIRKILADYDAMFGKYDLSDIENYLKQQLQQAEKENESSARITLLNEIIGFCRDTSQREKALAYCSELKGLADALNMQGTVEYATVLLNIANAYRAFDRLSEASDMYMQVLDIYNRHADTPEYLYASLYNNWSHVYQELGNYIKAKELLEKALKILMNGSGLDIQQATTRVNIASALLNIGTEEAYVEASAHLQQALSIFEKDGGRDFHYSAALVAMGDACSFRKDYQQAAEYYSKGLKEIEKHTGHNDNYKKTLLKYEDAKRKLVCNTEKQLNMKRCREFYEKYGRSMIRNEFPEYENRIAVGLAGEGSDCFGFDDSISADHDYAPGFCMWLTNEDYEKIGSQLQAAYDNLIKKVYSYGQTDRFIRDRRGVSTISDFYNKIFRISCDFQNGCAVNYLNVHEFQLAAATNGEVFRDDLGIFTRVRKKLMEHYPQDILRRKLAQELHEFSQYAQSNYPRMMARGDQLTSNLCVAKAVENVMNIYYLLNGTYAPYYKWKRKGLERISGTSSIIKILDEIAATPCQGYAWKSEVYSPVRLNNEDRMVMLFEKAAGEILDELKKKGFASGDELFLETHIAEVLQGVNEKSDVRETLIQDVIALEWKQFDKVHNEGGRAACQDNYETFYIMRMSQYLTWPKELLESFCDDLKAAENRGWNLIMEKYARMMKNTDPAKYLTVEKQLPILSEERIRLQEAIISIQIRWMEEFAAEFPKMADSSRNIHSADDSTYNTSYETYLRGEVSTYSDKTFAIYAGFVSEVMKSGRNLTREIMENTARLYGYSSLEDAERKHK